MLGGLTLMINNKKILVLGGDSRQTFLAKRLYDKGYDVYCFGFNIYDNSKLKKISSLNDIKEQIDVLVLPIISSNDDRTVNAPFFDGEITLDEAVSAMKPHSIVVGGNLSKNLRTLFFEHGHFSVDYYIRDELKIKNCIPTAEGALSIAIEEMPITVAGSKILIIGFGRVGKACAKLFKALESDVSICARNLNAFAWAELYGYKSIDIDKIDISLSEFDLIINTVPAKILDKEKLSKINKNTLVIDLASKPGGVDFDNARQLGLKTIWALSLPGKVAPVTSGKIIADTILNILDERGDDPWQ